MSALQKLTALRWPDRFLLLEAWLYLGAARVALLTIPFKHIAPHLGRRRRPDEGIPSQPPASPEARRISWGIVAMSSRTPWESACLAQAIAAKCMLGRRGIPSFLFLGTRKDETGGLAAHAWLQTGSEVLLGGAGFESFTALSSFGELGPHTSG